MLRIRPATADDLETCLLLSRIPELKHASGTYMERRYIVKYLDENFFLVAEKNGKVIGFIYGERIIDNGALVWGFTVSKDCRGKGVGERLLKAYERKMKCIKVEWIILYADIRNKKTMGFYKKFNYKRGQKMLEFVKEF